MYTLVKKSIFIFVALFLPLALLGQEDSGYRFTLEKEILTTPVKNQQRTGTCWSYATASFIETELLRMGKPEIILSPMFFVRHSYSHRADRYVRFHGTNNFGQGSQAHNVMDVIREKGLVPEEHYTGLQYGEDQHVHSELAAMLKAMLDVVIKNPNRKLSTAWKSSIELVLDNYLGASPETFTYDEKEYTPTSFADWLEVNPDDYIEISSYTHHPFYEQFVLEIPDNWAHKSYYNLPLNEFMEVMDNALENGFSVAWIGDVSEKSFVHKKGLAVLPIVKLEEMADSEQARWSDLPESKRMEELFSFKEVVPEVTVNQQTRQQSFDNLQTTDDHLMHLTGLSRDQHGNRYYLTKNSWGMTDHIYDGYLHMSESYVREKTVAFMVHKDALPVEIAQKLGLR